MPVALTSYMDNETAEAFAKVLEYIVNSLGDMVENNGQSVLEYIGELGAKIVAYKAGIAYIWITVAAIALISGIIVFIMAKVRDDDFYIFISICLLLVGLIIAIVNSYQLVECYTFPEKTIIEYVQDEYKGLSTR